MATHPHSAETNGHGNSSTTKIEKLLAFHESAAAAIRMTIGLMNGHAKAAKTNGHTSILADAIALDGARASKKKGKMKPPKRDHSRAVILAQREKTERTLAAFHAKNPRPLTDVAAEVGVTVQQIAVGPLLRGKYLKRKRGGFVRTAKAYVVNKHAASA